MEGDAVTSPLSDDEDLMIAHPTCWMLGERERAQCVDRRNGCRSA
jgi:hypothetical protein